MLRCGVTCCCRRVFIGSFFTVSMGLLGYHRGLVSAEVRARLPGGGTQLPGLQATGQHAGGSKGVRTGRLVR